MEWVQAYAVNQLPCSEQKDLVMHEIYDLNPSRRHVVAAGVGSALVPGLHGAARAASDGAIRFGVPLPPIGVESRTEALQQLDAEGLGMVVCEQDVMTASRLSERAVVMDRGVIVQAGPSSARMYAPAGRKAYLGMAIPN